MPNVDARFSSKGCAVSFTRFLTPTVSDLRILHVRWDDQEMAATARPLSHVQALDSTKPALSASARSLVAFRGVSHSLEELRLSGMEEYLRNQ
ncbi:hypothetical protein V2A60_002658 [Cordyceps javanica]|nr:hypothetical protein IF2G_06465 [Cordyceps javanica]